LDGIPEFLRRLLGPEVITCIEDGVGVQDEAALEALDLL